MFKTLRRRIAVFLTALAALAAVEAVAATPANAASPYNIRSLYTGFSGNWCMDVRDVSYSNGALIQLYQCLGPNQMNQRWYLFPVPEWTGYYNVYQIVAAHSGKCLDVKDYNLSDGAPLQQWDCLGYGQQNQLWQRIDNGTSAVRWESIFSGHRLGHGGTFNGAQIVAGNSYSRWWTAADA